jgi:hypothetical protein
MAIRCVSAGRGRHRAARCQCGADPACADPDRGLVASQVRQAQAEQRATLFDAAAAGREATRATDAAWAALAGAEAQIAANQAGVDAANLALSG